MKKKIFVSVTIILVLFVLLILFKSQFYRLTPEININNRIKAELFELGKKSLKSLDVPVASVIIYNDSIIGRGYNTVLRDTSAGGHSEINAISDAIKHLGIEKFNELNRDSLILISTFEPCIMCKGAIQLYKIKHVYFLKGKSPFLWIKNFYSDLLYEKNKQKTGSENLQDSLFKLHPYYNTVKEELIP